MAVLHNQFSAILSKFNNHETIHWRIASWTYYLHALQKGSQSMIIRQPINAPKRSCPRDLGYWYCDDCITDYLERSSNSDVPVEMHSCRKQENGNVCGETHLGYAWCEECKAQGRTVPNQHIGEYELVAVMMVIPKFEIAPSACYMPMSTEV